MLPMIDAASCIVPVTQIKWLLDQPDDVLSAAAMQRESIQADYSLLDPNITQHDYQAITIKRDLTRSIGDLIPEIEDELNWGADRYWGKDTENWHEICVMKTTQRIVTRTANRVFVGLPLCKYFLLLVPC